MAESSHRTASAVYRQMLEDYPPAAIAWVRAASWTGPTPVPISSIDYSEASTWRASVEPEKVKAFAEKIAAGDLMKPIILVKEPKSDKYIVVDGHHRAMAYRKLGKPALAYIATVGAVSGPWDETHASQYTGPSKLEARDRMVRLDLGVGDVHLPGALSKPQRRSMGKLTSGKRDSLRKEQFALPSQRKYPIHDAAHVRNAASRLAQAKKGGKISDSDYRTARAAIKRAAKREGIHSELKDSLGTWIPDSNPIGEMVRKPDGGRAKRGNVRVRADLGPGGHLHVRQMSDGTQAVFCNIALHLGEEVDPTIAGVALKGPPAWKDGTPKKLVWVQLAEVGAWRGHSAGAFEMTATTFAQIVRNFTNRGLPIPFDFEHASEQDPTSGSIPVIGAPAPGWVHRMDNRERAGLWGLVEWLDKARDGIKEGAYGYLSPAIRFGCKDPVTGDPIGARLSSVAITNQPFLTGLEGLKAATDTAGGAAAGAEDSMSKFSFGGPKAILKATERPAGAPQISVTVQMGGKGQTALAHKPGEYMSSIKACMGMHPLCSAQECADRLEQLRDHVDACGDAEGQNEGLDLSSYTRPMRDLVGATPGDSWEDVFDAVEALIRAAMDEHIVEDHGGASDASMTAATDKNAAVAANKSNEPGATPATEEITMADKDEILAALRADFDKQLNDKLAPMSLQLKDLNGKVSEQESTIKAKDTEIKRLSDDLAKRDSDAAEALVIEAFDAYKDKKALTEDDKASMRITLKSDPGLFAKLYPRVSASERHLLSNLTGKRTTGGEGSLPAGGQLRLPSIAAIARRLASEKGIPLSEAQCIVFSAAVRARRAA